MVIQAKGLLLSDPNPPAYFGGQHADNPRPQAHGAVAIADQPARHCILCQELLAEPPKPRHGSDHGQRLHVSISLLDRLSIVPLIWKSHAGPRCCLQVSSISETHRPAKKPRP